MAKSDGYDCEGMGMTENFRGTILIPPRSSLKELYIKRALSTDPQDLRAALLLFDRIDIPNRSTGALMYDLGPDEQFLVDAGAAERSWVHYPHLWDLPFADRVDYGAYHQHEKSDPGIWSVFADDSSSGSVTEAGRGTLIRLTRAIPVPDRNVPLPEILAFKEKRRPELLDMRFHIEGLYQKIMQSADSALAIQTELGALTVAIDNQLKVSKESRLSFKLSDLNASINFVSAACGAITAHSLGAPLVASLAAGLGAAVSVTKGAALKAKTGQTTPSPYRYVSSYHNELI